ncbi:MAG TPA: NAD-dependent epimerase/dehydratase family protein, partial [Vicinamibacteria bacterium]|nr:NAD-dependent epimerase/dehydratase family protein [Vicinamibacteria bacterium]
MRVLVIGGTRFMGYGLVWRLLLGGHAVTLLNRGQTPDPFGDRVRRLQGDRTTDLRRLVAGHSFEAAVDFAAFQGSDVAQAVEALAGGGLGHYVLISTGQVYLVREGCPQPARESDYDGPTLPPPPDAADRAEWEYGMGKRAAEDVLHEAWRSRRFPGTVLRIPVVNGERDHTRRLESYLWRLLDGGPILLPGGGGQGLRHVYAHDVVRTIESLLGRQQAFGRAFNLCQEEAPSLRELVQRLAAILGARPRLVDVSAPELAAAGLTARAVSPFSSGWISFIDPSLAQAELGFRATPLDQALASIVASFLAHLADPPAHRYATRPQELALAARLGHDSSSARGEEGGR